MKTNARSVRAPLARRLFIERSAGLVASALGAATLAPLLVPGRARAAAADYRALVCVFLYGGNDGNNTIVPRDETRYGQYAAVRNPLGLPPAETLALPLESLVSLPVNRLDNPAQPYGLHPSLAKLKPFWDDGSLAAVFNVGPLVKPITQAQYIANPTGASVPGSLFSHSAQQALWECGGADPLSRTGWGGRASTALATADPVISVGADGGRFGAETLRSPLQLPYQPDAFGAMDLIDETFQPRVLRRAALDSMNAEGRVQATTLRAAFSARHRDAFATAELKDANGINLAAIVAATPGASGPASFPLIDAAFAQHGLIVGNQVLPGLVSQMYQIAKLISVNASGGPVLPGAQQIFSASLQGFDHHADQLPTNTGATRSHAELLTELGQALAAFQDAMVNLGLADQVTTFTQSDFGRTFRPNKSLGSDHGWGNHQLVLGGAVKGGRTFGTFPALVLGGPDDVTNNAALAQGRWIPTSSVDQYAATLLQWMRADVDLATVLPNLRNFKKKTLGFL